jgi:hypothetical protein
MRFFLVERVDDEAVLVEFTPKQPHGRPRKPPGPYRGPDWWYDQHAPGAGRSADCQRETPQPAKARP